MTPFWESARAPGLTVLLIVCLLLLGCDDISSPAAGEGPIPVTLNADGQQFNLTSSAATVRELLDEAGVELGQLDEVSPPLFTPLTPNLEVTVVRVSESLEVITEIIPFERRLVRTDSMDANDEPQIVQPGKNGLQEVTVRIVFRNGLESERWRTNETVLEEPQDELVLIGIDTNRGNVNFPGLLAIINNGTAVLMRGNTAVPETIDTGGRLDGRVFSLSPSGSHLLYTRTTTGAATFNNSLWLVGTQRGAEPVSLGVENVLWADWNPTRTEPRQIAYTTADPAELPPGWEANNDLWLGSSLDDNASPFTTTQLIDAYPALNGWWGGNYAWSPNGRFLAYAYANEIGLIDTSTDIPSLQRRQLVEFTPFNTQADWVWVPSLTWSPDGRFLAFTQHTGEDEQAMTFDSLVIDTQSPLTARFVEQTGMWGHLHWATSQEEGKIAFLKTADPVDSLRSGYNLWLMDQDGSNATQVYPPLGENSALSRDQRFMAWSPDGQAIAFIFDDDLFMLELESGDVTRITQDDNTISHPTWAPYGAGFDVTLPADAPETPADGETPTRIAPNPFPTPPRSFVPDE